MTNQDDEKVNKITQVCKKQPTLFISLMPDSAPAFDLLNQAGIDFSIATWGNDDGPPTLFDFNDSGHLLSWRGLDSIKDYTEQHKAVH